MPITTEQQSYMDHLVDSLHAFREAIKIALLIDDNRESHLDAAAAARDELRRSHAQLIRCLGFGDLTYCTYALAAVTVPADYDVYSNLANAPGSVDYLLRYTNTGGPVNIAQDTIKFDNDLGLIPRL